MLQGAILVVLDGTDKLGLVLGLAQDNGFTITQMKTVRSGSAGISVALEIQGKQSIDAWKRTVESYSLSGTVSVASVASDGSAQYDAIFGKGSPKLYAPSSANVTLCIVKPHVVKEGKAGALIRKIQEVGFGVRGGDLWYFISRKISRAIDLTDRASERTNERTNELIPPPAPLIPKPQGFEYQVLSATVVHMSPASIEEFAAVYKGAINSDEYCGMAKELASGQAVVLALTKAGVGNVVDAFRASCGPYIVPIAKKVQPNSLRGTFGRSTSQNAVHCTDLPNEGVLECDFFFRL